MAASIEAKALPEKGAWGNQMAESVGGESQVRVAHLFQREPVS
jgi:hypothetical protein